MRNIRQRVARLEAKQPDPDRPYLGCIPLEAGMTEEEYRAANERAMARGPLTDEEWIKAHGVEICVVRRS